VYLGKGVKDAKDIEQPQDHADHDDAIEDGLDVVLHGDEPIHTPEQEAHYDERDYEMHRDMWFSFHETRPARRQ
jgi:hypothetical protein